MNKLTCENCAYFWRDPEHESRPSCHFPGEGVWWPAPCEEEEYVQIVEDYE